MSDRLTYRACLDRLDAAVRGVGRDEADVEALHQLRVCARQLTVGLRLAGFPALAEAVRRSTRTLGRARDLDVLLARDDLPPGLRAWAVAARRRECVASPRWVGLMQALRSVRPAFRSAAAARLAWFERRAQHAGNAWLRGPRRGPEAVLRAHRLRRRLRQWRFAQEWLGRDASALLAPQKLLGRLADEDLALQAVRRWKQEGGGDSRFARGQRARVNAALVNARRGKVVSGVTGAQRDRFA